MDRERLEEILQSIDQGVIHRQADGDVLFFNQAAQRILGLSAVQMEGIKYLDYLWQVAYEDGSPCPPWDQPFETTLRTGRAVENQVRGLVMADGQITWLSFRTRPLFEPDRDRPASVIVIFSDITANRLAEEGLRRGEAVFQAMLENSAVPAGLNDAQGRWVMMNPALCSLLGYTQQEIIGKTVLDLSHPEDRAAAKANMQAMLQGRLPNIRLEKRLLRKDGSIIWLDLWVSPLRDEQGRVTGFIGAGADITERKRTEEALRENEQILRSLADNLKNAMIYQMVATPQGHRRFTYVSGSVERLHETTVEKVLADAGEIYRQIVPECVPMLQELEERAIRSLTPFRAEVQCRLPSGRLRWFDFSSTPRWLADGALVWDGIGVDITETKLAQEALRQGEQMLRNLADNLRDAVIYQLTVPPDGGRRFTYVSGSVERLNEVPVERVLADAGEIYGQVLPEYLAQVAGREEEALKNLTPFRAEVLSRLPSGRLRWFDYSSTPRRLADGTLVWDGIQVDVTERKQLEEALRHSEEKFFRAFKRAPIMAAITRLEDGTYLEVNDLFMEISGFTPREVLGKTSVQVGWITAQDRARVIEVLQREGRVSGLELTSHAKDGSPIPCLYNSEVLTLGGEKRLLTMVLDIRERKRAEEALRQSEERYRQLVESAPIGIYEFDLTQGRFLSVNDVMCQFTGYGREELLALDPTQLLGEESRDLYRGRLAMYAAGGLPPASVELAVRKKGGQVMWARLTARVTQRQAGRMVASVVAQDISHVKRLEEELGRCRERLAALGRA